MQSSRQCYCDVRKAGMTSTSRPPPGWVLLIYVGKQSPGSRGGRWRVSCPFLSFHSRGCRGTESPVSYLMSYSQQGPASMSTQSFNILCSKLSWWHFNMALSWAEPPHGVPCWKVDLQPRSLLCSLKLSYFSAQGACGARDFWVPGTPELSWQVRSKREACPSQGASSYSEWCLYMNWETSRNQLILDVWREMLRVVHIKYPTSVYLSCLVCTLGKAPGLSNPREENPPKMLSML